MTDAERAQNVMRLILTLRSRGVTDPAILRAFETIDRGLFVTGIFADRAYEDTPLPIGCGQTISQPSVVALMTEALEVTPRDKVLEVGTGSGYQAAILSRLARRVYTVERHRPLIAEARALFARLDLHNITAIATDGSFGLPDQAPFRGPPRPPAGAAAPGRDHGRARGPDRHGAEPHQGAQDRAGLRLRRAAAGAIRAAARRDGAGLTGWTSRPMRGNPQHVVVMGCITPCFSV